MTWISLFQISICLKHESCRRNTSCIVDPIDAYFVICSRQTKDAFLWQHGEEGILGQRDIYTESSELRICTKYLAYTELVGSELNNAIFS